MDGVLLGPTFIYLTVSIFCLIKHTINFEAVLDLMSSGALNMKPLISHRFEIDDAINAYKCLDDRSSLGILLNYSANADELLTKKLVSIRDAENYDGGKT